jgi:hypothetical protein
MPRCVWTPVDREEGRWPLRLSQDVLQEGSRGEPPLSRPIRSAVYEATRPSGLVVDARSRSTASYAIRCGRSPRAFAAAPDAVHLARPGATGG